MYGGNESDHRKGRRKESVSLAVDGHHEPGKKEKRRREGTEVRNISLNTRETNTVVPVRWPGGKAKTRGIPL